MDKTAAIRMSPTALAFVGDAVYTLYIRRIISVTSDCVTGTLHVQASKYVNANSQAEVFDELIACGVLTETEADIARRAKNAHLHSRAKTATSAAYHKATALEAILGYTELAGDADRLAVLLDLCARFNGLSAAAGE